VRERKVLQAREENKHGEAVFAEVDISGIEEEIGQQFNISGYPALLVVIGLHGNGQKYRLLNKDWKESIKVNKGFLGRY